MRTLEEIVGSEERNLSQVVLYPEGMFYKAYERSAYVCATRIAPFRPSRKRVKYLGRDVVSVGFPMQVLEKYFPGASPQEPGGCVVVELAEAVGAQAFEAWKAALPFKEPRARVPSAAAAAPVETAAGLTDTAPSLPSRSEDEPFGRLAQLIRGFRLEAATPLQCVLFIDELKRVIDGRL